MGVHKKAKKEERITRALIRINADLSKCSITERIHCPTCNSSKIYVNKKWQWNKKFHEIDLITDWTCKDCKSDFEGHELESQLHSGRLTSSCYNIYLIALEICVGI